MGAPIRIYMPNELLSEEWERHIDGEDIEYIRKDAIIKILNEEKETTGSGVCEYDMGHENGRMEIIEVITNKINQL